jgi:N-hydroxyarylamine O-acetyltransferase
MTAAAPTIPPVRLLQDAQVLAYLDRIGVPSRPERNEATLRDLQLAHLLTVPFENLSIHLGEPISLQPDEIFDKIVKRRRGGFCFELNGLFASLLATLGFEVRLAAAGVYGPAGLGPPMNHLALIVDGRMVDVGFGRNSASPLRLDITTDQPDPCGTFRVEPAPTERDFDVRRDGELQYRVDTKPRALADFEPACWWHQTNPRSRFRSGLTCSLLTPTGRITLSERTLLRTDGTGRSEDTLGSDEQVLAAYRDLFGIVLDRVPTVRP